MPFKRFYFIVADVSYAYPLYSLCDYFRCTLYKQVCEVLIFGASYMYRSDCVSWLTCGHDTGALLFTRQQPVWPAFFCFLPFITASSFNPACARRLMWPQWTSHVNVQLFSIERVVVELSTSSVTLYERVLLSEIDVSCLSGVCCPEAGRLIVLKACVAWIDVRTCVVPSWDRSSHWWSTSPLTAWSHLAVLPSLFYSSEQRAVIGRYSFFCVPAFVPC